jgi:hypothetical protein
MKVAQLAEWLKMEPAAGNTGLQREVRGGYCGDLLSDVMANAPPGCVWMTVQGHMNIVAVALLRDVAAIVLTGDRRPDAETVARADQEGIPLLTWRGSSYELAGELHALGVGAPPAE